VARMATLRAAKRYLDDLKSALVQGVGWRSPQLITDVLKIAHVLRCLKLSPKLARNYLCIHHPAAHAHVLLRVEEAPHVSIPKLKEEEAPDFRDDFLKAFQGVNSELSHVTLIKFDTDYQLETLLYFGESCDQLMEEEKCAGYAELPTLIAEKAKQRGQSASKGDITCSIHVPKRDLLVEKCLQLSDGKRPDDGTMRVVLVKRGLPITEDAMDDLLGRCIGKVGRQIAESERGVAGANCRNSTCCKLQERGSKRLLCSKCMRVSYCSKECQKGDWESHKRICVRGAVGVISTVELLRDNQEFIEAYDTKSVFSKS
jgi:hypothetical protein